MRYIQGAAIFKQAFNLGLFCVVQANTGTSTAKLAADLPASAVAMQAETTGEDLPTEPASDQADAALAPSDIAAGHQSWHTAVPSKRSRDGDTGRLVPAAARASRDSLPSISEDLDAAGSPLAATKPITAGFGSAPKAASRRDGHGDAGLARLPSSWGSRASEASSATVLRAPSAEAGAGGTAVSERPAPVSRASGDESAAVPLDGAAAAAGGSGFGASKPPVPRLSSLASGGGSSKDVRPGGKLPGPLLSHSSSNATGGVASSVSNSAGSLAGSSNPGSSASALPKAIDAVLATGIRPKATDEGTAGGDIAGHRSRFSGDQVPGQAPGMVRSDDLASREAPADLGLLSGDNTCGAASEAGTEARPLPPSVKAELRALPPSALEARVEQAARLHGPQAPQVCCCRPGTAVLLLHVINTSQL